MRAVCRSILVVFAFLATVAVMSGCGNVAGDRVEVKGKVNLVGEPIKDGTINFTAADEANKASKSGAQILNGAYVIPQKQGLKPGKYVVSISSGEGGAPAGAGEDFAPGPSRNVSAVDRVPPDWNVQSKQQVEVKAGSSTQEFKFDIPNYNPKYKAPKR